LSQGRVGNPELRAKTGRAWANQSWASFNKGLMMRTIPQLPMRGLDRITWRHRVWPWEVYLINRITTTILGLANYLQRILTQPINNMLNHLKAILTKILQLRAETLKENRSILVKHTAPIRLASSKIHLQKVLHPLEYLKKRGRREPQKRVLRLRKLQ